MRKDNVIEPRMINRLAVRATALFQADHFPPAIRLEVNEMGRETSKGLAYLEMPPMSATTPRDCIMEAMMAAREGL
jgi:hypothetical protein